jgi:hypothetical protein
LSFAEEVRKVRGDQINHSNPFLRAAGQRVLLEDDRSVLAPRALAAARAALVRPEIASRWCAATPP